MQEDIYWTLKEKMHLEGDLPSSFCVLDEAVDMYREENGIVSLLQGEVEYIDF